MDKFQDRMKQVYRFLNPKFQNLFLEYKVEFKPRYGHGKPAHPDLLRIIELYRNDYRRLINEALLLKEALWIIRPAGRETSSMHPVWNNGFLPGLDIVGIYTLLSVFRPEKYIEIGSGNSTKVAYKAKREQNLDTKIISIDPMPRTEIDELADKIIREPFENIDFDLVTELNENDILFVDNSHRILPNSDSMVFFLEILPRLKKGVIVHLHDVYLPYDYPPFMCERFYSEQYGLAMFLLANPGKYTPLLPNYFVHQDGELSQLLEPLWDHPNLKGVEKHGGSFWLKINE